LLLKQLLELSGSFLKLNSESISHHLIQLIQPQLVTQLQIPLVSLFVMMLPQLQSAMEELDKQLLVLQFKKLFQTELLLDLMSQLLLPQEEISPHSNGIMISFYPHSSMVNTMMPKLHQLTDKHGVQPSQRKLLPSQSLSLLFTDSLEKLNVLGNSKLRMEVQLQDSN
jgi:hypothetical protein